MNSEMCNEEFEKLIFDIKKKRENAQFLKDIKESKNILDKSDIILSINKTYNINNKIKIEKICQKK